METESAQARPTIMLTSQEDSATAMAAVTTDPAPNTKYSAAVTPKSMNSMTLAISHDNATRMLEASRSLNAALHTLKSTSSPINTDPSSSSSSSNGSTDVNSNNNSSHDPHSTDADHDLRFLLQAAKSSLNPLLKTHVCQMQHDLEKGLFSRGEMMTCLFIFLDIAGKSSKLLYAFQELAAEVEVEGETNTNSTRSMNKMDLDDATANSAEKPDEEQEQELCLNREGIQKLFKCFLLSISTCIHYDGSHPQSVSVPPVPVQGSAVSPESLLQLQMQSNMHLKGWSLSMQTRKDIQEIADYATAKLMEYINTKTNTGASDSTSTSSGEENATSTVQKVTFQQFGEWYNSGGFSLVPWLELLDLTKWHYAGRAAEKAAAAEMAIEKHQRNFAAVRSSNRAVNAEDNENAHASNVFDAKMEPILEHFENPFDSPQLQAPMSEHAAATAASRPLPPASSQRQVEAQAQHPHPQQTKHPYPPPYGAQHHHPMPPQHVMPARPIVTFEFAGKKGFNIPITEENLRMFQELASRTGLDETSPGHISSILVKHAQEGTGLCQGIQVIKRNDLPAVVRDLVPNSAANIFSQQEMERFSSFFTIFFLSFARNANETNFQLGLEQVNWKELAVGFSFLCAGNKSQKLDETFKIIGDDKSDFLSQHKLFRFIRSYLRMILGISLLSSNPQMSMEHTNGLLGYNHLSAHIAGLCYTTEVGSNWVLDDFLRSFHVKGGGEKANGADKISFGDFATWYTDCGYSIAPWLEFLDHTKIEGLLKVHASKPAEPLVRPANSKLLSQQPQRNAHPHQQPSQQPPQRQPAPAEKQVSQLAQNLMSPSFAPMNPPTSSGKIRSFDEFVGGSPSPHQRKKAPHSDRRPLHSTPDQNDILSTFPLSNNRELIVLREDAAYVRAVVEQFGLLHLTPSAVWIKVFGHAKKSALKPLPQYQASIHKSGSEKSRDLDQTNFVEGVLKSIPAKCKKKMSLPPLAPTAQQTLENFFLSFDMNQVNRVAANQLMGGFALFCGGSKTNKLSFMFCLFDSRADDLKKKKKKSDEIASLCGKDVFYFLRSILIVLFSCCKQSLDLTAGPVGAYIADAANMVTNDIMKYQWKTRKVERVNFDEFGQWYNEGGYEVAPWIELLDLDKWAYLDKEKAEKLSKNSQTGLKSRLKDTTNTQDQVQAQDNPEKEAPVVKKDTMMSPTICINAPSDDVFDANQDAFFGTDMDIGEMDGFDVDFGFDMPLSKVGDGVLPDHYAGEELADHSIVDSPQHLMGKNAVQHAYTFDLTLNSETQQTMSVSQGRVQLLKAMILESGINEIEISTLCTQILSEKKGASISRSRFDFAINSVLGTRIEALSPKTTQTFNAFLRSIYTTFVSKKGGWANANELACGFIVLCKGRKSEKLEYAFEMLDTEKKGWITGSQMFSFLKSFLTVLIHISSCELGDQPSEIAVSCTDAMGIVIPNKDVIAEVSSWATKQVFKAMSDSRNKSFKDTAINFDNFADWYTNGGYSNMAWLELLDLEKWILLST